MNLQAKRTAKRRHITNLMVGDVIEAVAMRHDHLALHGIIAANTLHNKRLDTPLRQLTGLECAENPDHNQAGRIQLRLLLRRRRQLRLGLRLGRSLHANLGYALSARHCRLALARRRRLLAAGSLGSLALLVTGSLLARLLRERGVLRQLDGGARVALQLAHILARLADDAADDVGGHLELSSQLDVLVRGETLLADLFVDVVLGLPLAVRAAHNDDLCHEMKSL